MKNTVVKKVLAILLAALVLASIGLTSAFAAGDTAIVTVDRYDVSVDEGNALVTFYNADGKALTPETDEDGNIIAFYYKSYGEKMYADPAYMNVTVYSSTAKTAVLGDETREFKNGYCRFTALPVFPQHTHSYEIVTVAPTCTEDGSAIYTCECGDSYTEAIPALGHNYQQVVIPATCTQNGSTVYTCVVCGDSYVDNIVAAKGHSYEITTIPATCEQNGSVTYVCSCGETYEESIPAKGHIAAAAVIENSVPATCTEAGSYDSVVYCSVCGAEISRTTTTIPAKGHNVVIDSAVPATTEAEGLTEGSHCATCGAVLVAQIVIPAIPVETEPEPATETEPTETEPQETEPVEVEPKQPEEDIPYVAPEEPVEETPVEETTPADATPAEPATETEPVKVRTLVEIPAVAATCDTNGSTQGWQYDDGEVLVAPQTIPAFGHCDGDGDELCDRCGGQMQSAGGIREIITEKETTVIGEQTCHDTWVVTWRHHVALFSKWFAAIKAFFTKIF